MTRRPRTAGQAHQSCSDWPEGCFGAADDLTAAERQALGLDDNAGILLTIVHEGGPAAAAGLQRGDVVLSINSEPIMSRRQAQLISAGTKPGDEVTVVGLRDGERFQKTLIAGERPQLP